MTMLLGGSRTNCPVKASWLPSELPRSATTESLIVVTRRQQMQTASRRQTGHEPTVCKRSLSVPLTGAASPAGDASQSSGRSGGSSFPSSLGLAGFASQPHGDAERRDGDDERG